MVKRILTAVLGLVALVACIGEEPVETVSVKFEVAGLAGTKADSVSGVLSETEPTGRVKLRLVGQGQDVEVWSGESIELPVGEYAVSGHYEPRWNTDTGIATGVEPSYDVDCEVVVRKGVGSYSVSAAWDCWALVRNVDQVSAYECDGMVMESAGYGKYEVVYVLDAAEWTLTVVPADEEVEERTDFAIVESEMQKGAWYEYKAGRLWQGGGFNVAFPAWEEGVNG